MSRNGTSAFLTTETGEAFATYDSDPIAPGRRHGYVRRSESDDRRNPTGGCKMAEGRIIAHKPHGFPNDPGSHSQRGLPCEIVDWTDRRTDGFGTFVIFLGRTE